MNLPRPPRPEKRYDLVESFNALALAGKNEGLSRALPDRADAAGHFTVSPVAKKNEGSPHNASDPFVGGFSPERAVLNFALNAGRRGEPPAHYASRPTVKPPAPIRSDEEVPPKDGQPTLAHLPRPPAPIMTMPTPYKGLQSLTMQHALSTVDTGPHKSLLPPSTPKPPSRPHSESLLRPPVFYSPPASISVPGSPPALHTPPRRFRAISNPVSPASSSPGRNTVQCSGYTRAGPRCLLQVKVPVPLSDLIPDDEVELFCHHHRQDLLQPTGFYSSKTGQWIEFKDWIPTHLQQDTQIALRIEMEKSQSPSDVAGYIYTFEIRDPKNPRSIQLKVGRAVNLVKRLDQWGKQCGSKEQVLRGWWPGTVEDDDDNSSGSLMKGRIKAGEKGPLCHRLERLVHLELADLAAYAPYLDPKYPNCETPVKQTNGSSASPAKSKSPAKKVAKKPCLDCGTVHREIFTFPRAENGRYKGREWELIVQPVIEKWGGFVADCV